MSEQSKSSDVLLYTDIDRQTEEDYIYGSVRLGNENKIAIMYGGNSIAFTMEDWVRIGMKKDS
jgi:hypothetical protein